MKIIFLIFGLIYSIIAIFCGFLCICNSLEDIKSKHTEQENKKLFIVLTWVLTLTVITAAVFFIARGTM